MGFKNARSPQKPTVSACQLPAVHCSGSTSQHNTGHRLRKTRQQPRPRRLTLNARTRSFPCQSIGRSHLLSHAPPVLGLNSSTEQSTLPLAASPDQTKEQPCVHSFWGVLGLLCFSEPVWPSGKALRLVRTVRSLFTRTSVRICFGSPFSSETVVCGHCLVCDFVP